MKKTITFSLTLCALICACNSFGMKDDSEKIPKKRKDTQLQELISLQKTTNSLLLMQLEQNHLYFQYQALLIIKERTQKEKKFTTQLYNTAMKNLYQKYNIAIPSSTEDLK